MLLPPLLEQYYQSEVDWQPVDFNVCESRTGATTELKIIGPLDHVHQRVPDIHRLEGDD